MLAGGLPFQAPLAGTCHNRWRFECNLILRLPCATYRGLGEKMAFPPLKTDNTNEPPASLLVHKITIWTLIHTYSHTFQLQLIGCTCRKAKKWELALTACARDLARNRTQFHPSRAAKPWTWSGLISADTPRESWPRIAYGREKDRQLQLEDKCRGTSGHMCHKPRTLVA